jgi:hypothetical protein
LSGNNPKTHQFPFATYNREPLYENYREYGERKQRAVIRNLKGRGAFSHRQQMENDKPLWVEYDLAKEKRQMKKGPRCKANKTTTSRRKKDEVGRNAGSI